MSSDSVDWTVYVPLVLKEIGHEAAKSSVVVHVKLNTDSDSGPWRLSVMVQLVRNQQRK